MRVGAIAGREARVRGFRRGKNGDARQSYPHPFFAGVPERARGDLARGWRRRGPRRIIVNRW